jgi:osmotically-inducible protein OsmY
LRRDVVDELEWEPSVDAAEIGVVARDGVVTLTGAVKSYTDKLTAERVTKGPGGDSRCQGDAPWRRPLLVRADGG